MQVKQLELDLWDVLSTARQTPEDMNLPMVFQLLDLTLVDLDTRSQLRIAGEAVCQIADLFYDRSSFLFEELHSCAVKGEPLMADDAFDRYVRQCMVVDSCRVCRESLLNRQKVFIRLLPKLIRRF